MPQHHRKLPAAARAIQGDQLATLSRGSIVLNKKQAAQYRRDIGLKPATKSTKASKISRP